MVSALRLVVGEVVFQELWSVCRHHIGQASRKFIRAFAVVRRALCVQLLAQFVACVRIVSRVEITFGVNTAHVIHGGGNGSLDAGVYSRRVDRHTSPTANAEYANLLWVHVVTGRKVVHGRTEVLCVDVGRGYVSGLASALACKRWVEGDGKEAALGQFLRIQTRSLLLDGPERTANGDGGQFSRHAFRHIKVGGQRHAVTVMESYFAVVHLVALREHLVPLCG